MNRDAEILVVVVVVGQANEKITQETESRCEISVQTRVNDGRFVWNRGELCLVYEIYFLPVLSPSFSLCVCEREHLCGSLYRMLSNYKQISCLSTLFKFASVLSPLTTLINIAIVVIECIVYCKELKQQYT